MTLLALAASLLCACAGGPNATNSTFSDTTPTAIVSSEQYRIGPTDLLNVTVFQVPSLSLEDVRVDAAGELQMPLIGAVRAAGRTPDQLSSDIATALGREYLRNPQVSVTVAEASSQKVTVDGAVVKPGVYTMRGRTSLLQAVAMAEGPSRVANLKEVAVFRDGENGRMVALFDLEQIRSGRMQDPQIEGNDVIIVDTSTLNARFRDILQVLPGLAVFAYL